MVRIRLRRVGAKKQPSYRVVVADKRAPRDGRFIEAIGHYNPRTEPPTVHIYEDRAIYWLSKGAQPSEAVARFFDKMGLYEKVKAVHKGAAIEEVAAPRTEPEQGRRTRRAAPGRRARRKEEAEEAVAEAPEVEEMAPEMAEAEPTPAEAQAEAEPEPEMEAEPEPTEEAEPEPEPEAAVEEEEEAEPEEEPEVAEEEEPEPEPEPAPAAELSLEDLGLTTRVANVLHEAGITSAAELADALAEGDERLLEISGIGPKAVEEIRSHLAGHDMGPDA